MHTRSNQSAIFCLPVSRAQGLAGDATDVELVAKKVMNSCASKRIISKQETAVLLSGLDLTFCSDSIENVSISNSKRLRMNEEESTDKTFIHKYATRLPDSLHMSLYEYFHHTKNANPGRKKTLIPNFVGVSGTPKYPPTDEYARHVLTVYRPWVVYPKNLEWQLHFENFIRGDKFPACARMSYERVMNRHFTRTVFAEPTAKDGDHSMNTLSEADRDTIALHGLMNTEGGEDYDAAVLRMLDRGLSYNWDRKPKVRHQSHLRPR